MTEKEKELRNILAQWEEAYRGSAIREVLVSDRYGYVHHPSRADMGKLVNKTREVLGEKKK